MLLGTIDWSIIVAYFVLILLVGVVISKRAGRSSEEFFLGGRNIPFWLLGISMVATTFSSDTPNLVTDMVRNHGVSGNWLWWPFLLTSMLTVFVYSKLWRRSSVMTDIELYEIRYGGKAAAFLRGFRALYLGVIFNVIIMASVSLAAIKIGSVLLKMTPLQSIMAAMTITVIYSSLGGFRAILLTDFFLFGFSMFGAIMAAIIVCRLPQVGGLEGLFTHENIVDKLSLMPDFSDPKSLVPLFIIPLAVQWWSVWYPGHEPGGGGYLAQRMLAAKNENHAVGATLLYNCCHYALRPWPWILVALASLIIYPDLASLKTAFPHITDISIIQHDMAYPAMLTFLPHGILGIVVASLIGAYMSTISTHINWGSSYVVNDFYKRFIKPDATERELVLIGRISTVVLMILAGALALLLSSSLQTFHIILQIGAGTGLIFILRWFWWRINAWTEITGMVVSFLVAVYLEIIHVKLGYEMLPVHVNLVIGVSITTACWLMVTLLTKPTDDESLRKFYRLVRPGGKGWDKVIAKAQRDGDPIFETAKPGDLPLGILCTIAGCFAVLSTVFAVGFYLYGQSLQANICTVVAVVAGIFLVKSWGKLQMNRS